MTLIVNLFGAPSSGKSTQAAALFSVLKSTPLRELYDIKSKDTFLVETISEYAKELAWNNVVITREVQVEVAKEQIRRERALLGKVDVLITDSPVLLSPFYEYIYNSSTTTKTLVETYRSNAREGGHMFIDFMLHSLKGYDPNGRYQTEAEAIAIAEQMKTYLPTQWGVNCIPVDVPQPNRTKIIYDHLMEVLDVET